MAGVGGKSGKERKVGIALIASESGTCFPCRQVSRTSCLSYSTSSGPTAGTCSPIMRQVPWKPSVLSGRVKSVHNLLNSKMDS